jgi:hypothetical protein
MKDQQGRRLQKRPQPSAPAQLRLVEENRTEGARRVTPPPLIDPLAAFRPGLSYHVEPFAAIARELPRLVEMNWNEIEQDGFGMELNPDWDLLYDMAAVGRLQIMTARYRFSPKRPATLVGYIFNLVYPHIYSKKDLFGELHLFYLDPHYRDEPGFVMEWFRANDDYLVSLGCKKISTSTKMSFKGGRVGLIFKRLGYTPVETVWARMV